MMGICNFIAFKNLVWHFGRFGPLKMPVQIFRQDIISIHSGFHSNPDKFGGVIQ